MHLIFNHILIQLFLIKVTKTWQLFPSIPHPTLGKWYILPQPLLFLTYRQPKLYSRTTLYLKLWPWSFCFFWPFIPVTHSMMIQKRQKPIISIIECIQESCCRNTLRKMSFFHEMSSSGCAIVFGKTRPQKEYVKWRRKYVGDIIGLSAAVCVWSDKYI